MMSEQKAVIIQKWVRGWLERRRYRRALKAAVLLQCCVRCWRAKKELKSLKTEARSVEHLQKLNVGMENKIIQLQHKINEQVRSRVRSSPACSGISRSYWCGRHIGSLGVVMSHAQHVCPPSPCSIKKSQSSVSCCVWSRRCCRQRERQTAERRFGPSRRPENRKRRVRLWRSSSPSFSRSWTTARGPRRTWRSR